MMRLIDLRSSSQMPSVVIPRAELDIESAMKTVTPIIKDVELKGDDAILEWTLKLDGVKPASLKVPQKIIDQAFSEMSSDVIAALEESIRRSRIVHQSQLRDEKTTQVVAGGTVSEKWLPVERVGLYVPGGNAVYPSSVIMNVIPAQVAEVSSIAVASPAQKENKGWPNKTILAACKLLNITEVYAVGGAQAIAMFAYGTNTCRPVSMITGPGNIYVTAAKRILRGIVGIDSEAGPTEILILADKTGNAKWIAADLISQAEHDEIAASVLVTDSEELIKNLNLELATQINQTKHSGRIKKALTGIQSALVLVKNMEQGLLVVDQYAAEHLEIHTENAREVAYRVKNAGAIFIGPHSPVSLGDYLAGSNHVLPTGKCACHSSGLSVQTFLRGVHYIDYTEQALNESKDHIRNLAQAEDLPAHSQAVDIRFDS